MPFPIINSIASWVLKQRIHQIELFLKYPNEVQDELLMNLIRNCEETVIGKKYEFDSIRNYKTFTERVPVSTYEELEPMFELTRKGAQNVFWNTPIKWFAKSSGTTNAKSKFIPVSNEALEAVSYTHLDVYKRQILGGSFTTPKITTDVKTATTTLVNNLVKQQKEQLIGKGKNELENLINKNKKPGDTTKTKVPATKEEVKQEVKTKAKDLLNGWLKKKEKPASTTTTP